MRFSWEGFVLEAAKVLQSAGYDVEITRSHAHPALTWQLSALATTPLTARFLDPLRSELEQLARTCGGVYDGWRLA